jgi:hypothetical protein
LSLGWQPLVDYWLLKSILSSGPTSILNFLGQAGSPSSIMSFEVDFEPARVRFLAFEVDFELGRASSLLGFGGGV